jgi:hypothetical protein
LQKASAGRYFQKSFYLISFKQATIAIWARQEQEQVQKSSSSSSANLKINFKKNL